MGYSIAPGAVYPTPVRQVNAALAYLSDNAKALGIDPQRFILAGDSAGAQIAAQAANIITSPDYAAATGLKPGLAPKQLAGVILFCGPYDAGAVNLNGPFGLFLTSVLWSYSGTRDFASDKNFAKMSVANYVTAEFPPAFVSAGNADPLLPQSQALVAALKRRNAVVEDFFLPADYAPPQGHEYQFNLATAAGKQAYRKTVDFVRRVTGQ